MVGDDVPLDASVIKLINSTQYIEKPAYAATIVAEISLPAPGGAAGPIPAT
jgi:hypothetical protein